MTIDPSTCTPDELYVVKAQYTGVAERYGMRVNKGLYPWAVLDGSNHNDDEVTVIRRADQPLTDWEILRQAAAVYEARTEGPCAAATGIRIYADRLEAEHKREALIEKVAGTIAHARWGKADAYVMPSARHMARALADAGLLAEAVES
ncbi:hypothetical protein [Gordonia sp. (in: high G+C Gram-positive bacteria)]|uniref:hypothetical protein n=1 Tax=Gordonia sp. (in: high G+C Gram-positive bacteria) TaxID=84139 RepID=UPI003F996020